MMLRRTALALAALCCANPALALRLDDTLRFFDKSLERIENQRDEALQGDACSFSAPTAPLAAQEVVARALCVNPETRKAWAGVLASAAQTGVARAAYFPSIDVTGEIANTRQDFRKVAGVQLETDTRGASLRMGWVLFDFGRRSARLNEAIAKLDSANATLDATNRDVALEALRAYYQTLAAAALLQSARNVEAQSASLVTTARARQRAGVASLVDLRTAENERANLAIRRVRAEADLEKARGRLAVLIGLPVEADLPLPDPLATSFSIDDDPGFAQWARVSDTHPKLESARAEVRAAEERVRLAQAENYPALVFNAQHVESPAPNSTTVSPDRVTSIAAQLSVPLFRGFESLYKVRAARADLDARRAEADGIEQRQRLGIWEAYQDWRSSVKTLELALEAENRATENERAAQARARAGVGDPADLIKLRQAQLDAARQTQEARAAQLIARARLAVETGELGSWLNQQR